MPESVAIIMDGNRRYARERGLPLMEGHRKGYGKLKDIVAWSKEAGVKEVIVYAFSTENWNRAPEEVAYLMDLLQEAVESGMKEIVKEDICIRFLGSRARLSPELVRAMDALEVSTKDKKSGTLGIALSYGGRDELVAAAEALRGSIEPVTEESLSNSLYTRGMRDPDLIIRTGGEMRLSNFLPWQGVYSELMFTKTKWPELSKEEYLGLLSEFGERERRRGV